MSLPLLPYVQTSSGKQLLDGQVYEDLSHEQQYEALALNRVNVPFTWKRSFSEVVDEDGLLCWKGNRIWMDGSGRVTVLLLPIQGMKG